MNPRLVALTGPLKCQVITLMAETSIGRGSSNHIAVSDPSLSRRHCLITGVEAGFTLTNRDLETAIKQGAFRRLRAGRSPAN